MADMNRQEFLTLLASGAAGAALGRAGAAAPAYGSPPDSRVQAAAYYFPAWHADPRMEAFFGRGWSEWELIARAEARFSGHDQPKRPLWGFEDEARPSVHARKIDAAADHGLDAFIYDWYWYHDGPMLQRALEEGYLKAHNNGRVKFALMWANHDWRNLFPVHRSTHVETLRSNGKDMTGAVDREVFDAATEHVVNTYLGHPSYWRPDGRAYFSIYRLETLIAGLGGTDATRAALDAFRAKARAAGAGELHLNAVTNEVGSLSKRNQRARDLGIDSHTSYGWNPHIGYSAFPTTPYAEQRQKAPDVWRNFADGLEQPYFPAVAVGWDPSPRTVQSDMYENLGYPYTPVLVDNTPGELELAVRAARRFAEAQPEPRAMTIYAWNEWSEGSYLEPEQGSGMGRLEALERALSR